MTGPGILSLQINFRQRNSAKHIRQRKKNIKASKAQAQKKCYEKEKVAGFKDGIIEIFEIYSY